MSCSSSATSATQAFPSMTRPTRTPTTRPSTTAGNATSSKAGTTARSTGTSNATTAKPPIVERRTNWKPQDGTSTAITQTTASARTTTISHAANAAKWDVGPLHRLEYEGWQLNSTDPNDSLCPECVKAKEETK